MSRTKDVPRLPAPASALQEPEIIRGPDGRFLPGTRPPGRITPENAHEFHRLRREKMRARLRARIREETQGATDIPLHGSADAVAEAAAILWHDIVLNPEAYARDRLEALWKIGQLLELIPGAGAPAPSDHASDTAALAGLGREQILAFVEARQAARRQDHGTE